MGTIKIDLEKICLQEKDTKTYPFNFKTVFNSMYAPLYVYYINKNVRKLYEQNGGVKTDLSVGFDCVAIKDYKLKKNEIKLINLGIIVKPAPGFRISLYPRSSTFKKYKILQTNSVGIIDPDYCGKQDILHMPVIAFEDTEIKKGSAICQLVVEPAFYIQVEEFEPKNKSRGGFGSTDKR